jgi:hypothetical protein
MSEERAPYTVPNDDKWIDVRFADGKHTGVRVLRGTTVIEVIRDRRKTLVDIAEMSTIDLSSKAVYDR